MTNNEISDLKVAVEILRSLYRETYITKDYNASNILANAFLHLEGYLRPESIYSNTAFGSTDRFFNV